MNFAAYNCLTSRALPADNILLHFITKLLQNRQYTCKSMCAHGILTFVFFVRQYGRRNAASLPHAMARRSIMSWVLQSHYSLDFILTCEKSGVIIIS